MDNGWFLGTEHIRVELLSLFLKARTHWFTVARRFPFQELDMQISESLVSHIVGNHGGE